MKQFMSDKDNVIIITVSIIAFVVGCISIYFGLLFIIRIAVLLTPLLNKNLKTNTSKANTKTEQLKTEKIKMKRKKKKKKKYLK